MAFKLKGHGLPGPNQKISAFPIHEPGHKEYDDVAKFRTEEDEEKGITSFTRGNRYNTFASDAKTNEDGELEYTDVKDDSRNTAGDGIVDQGGKTNEEGGRSVTLRQYVPTKGEIVYSRDVDRWKKGGDEKGINRKGQERDSNGRVISERRYNRIMKRKNKKQDRKDQGVKDKAIEDAELAEKRAADEKYRSERSAGYAAARDSKIAENKASQAEKDSAAAEKQAIKDKTKADKAQQSQDKKELKSFGKMGKEGSYDPKTKIYTGSSGTQLHYVTNPDTGARQLKVVPGTMSY
tara:strand:- start:773 stop:1651 length:879 start_codon:yes stop_codon:yes gene_type:complete